jgi:hypothetical protein
VLAFHEPGDTRAAPGPLPMARLDGRAGDARPIVCAACGFAITRNDARIAVGGEHEHTRVNPAGWVYRFGCFAEAPGCRPSGVPSKQATWFAGYWWYAQVCGGCAEHLGWLFFIEPSESQFYGLVLDRLAEASQPAP